MKNLEKGITLIEIIVVIFIISMFSTVLISDFPRIQRQFALSRATYKLAQDIRKTQDLGLSGVKITDAEGNLIDAKGYGIFINLAVLPSEQYVIYADKDGDNRYTSDFNDYIVETVIVNAVDSDLEIKEIININDSFVSINFSPPDPITKIDTLQNNDQHRVGIVLGLKSDDSVQKTVWVNTSGLIRVQ